jgi:hypothetical protein
VSGKPSRHPGNPTVPTVAVASGHCTDQQRWNDGAYLLGSLPLNERHAYERHLGVCTFCRAGILRLSGLVGLLRLVRENDVADLPRLAGMVCRGRVGAAGSPVPRVQR